jgi:hypothetical protein
MLFDTIKDIQAEWLRVLDILTEKDFQEVFQKWRRRWDGCLYVGRNYLEPIGRMVSFIIFTASVWNVLDGPS